MCTRQYKGYFSELRLECPIPHTQPFFQTWKYINRILFCSCWYMCTRKPCCLMLSMLDKTYSRLHTYKFFSYSFIFYFIYFFFYFFTDNRLWYFHANCFFAWNLKVIFAWKKGKNIINLSSAKFEFAQTVVNVIYYTVVIIHFRNGTFSLN